MHTYVQTNAQKLPFSLLGLGLVAARPNNQLRLSCELQFDGFYSRMMSQLCKCSFYLEKYSVLCDFTGVYIGNILDEATSYQKGPLDPVSQYPYLRGPSHARLEHPA